MSEDNTTPELAGELAGDAVPKETPETVNDETQGQDDGAAETPTDGETTGSDETPDPAPEKPKRTRKPKPAEPAMQDRGRKVTIDRIVRYVTASLTERPAIITRVNDDDTVDLTVFNSAGATPLTKVHFDPFDGETPGTWHWPTYD